MKLNSLIAADSAFSSFSSSFNTTTGTLSAFNFLNKRDLGNFYHVVTVDKTTTLLVSSYRYFYDSAVLKLTPVSSDAIVSAAAALSLNSEGSGDRLCFGSL